jgi:hypothetical protein
MELYPTSFAKRAIVLGLRVVMVISLVFLICCKLLLQGVGGFMDDDSQRVLDWDKPFTDFDAAAIEILDFQGIGVTLDQLLVQESEDWCVTAAEIGLAVPYLVLRGTSPTSPSRHYINARVTPVRFITDRTGKVHPTEIRARTEVATHCKYLAGKRHAGDEVLLHAASVKTEKGVDSDTTHQYTADTGTEGTAELPRADVEESSGADHSFLWKLHLMTHAWLSRHTDQTGKGPDLSIHLDEHGESVHLPILYKDRYVLADITAIDARTGIMIEQTLVNEDAFCAQGYSEIALGQWSCSPHMGSSKEEL